MADLRLSLEHMTVLGMAPEEIIATAETLAAPYISLILDSGSFPLPITRLLADPAAVARTKARLAASPVRLHGAEGLFIAEATDFERAERLCEIAATLGAERIIAIGIDPDRARTVDSMARLAAIGAGHGLQVSLEFVAATCVATLADAVEVVEGCGAANAAISIDILHLVRSGGAVAELTDRPLRVGAAQLCDGPLRLAREQWWDEGLSGRLPPGDGEFPIVPFLDALPAGTIVGLEVPQGLPWPGDELAAAAAYVFAAARALSPRFAA